MLARLFLLFTLVPLAELILLVWIGRHTGWLVTLALILVPGIAGAALARYQGLRCWRAAHEQLARGALPTNALLDGLMILVAGVLLITPGILSDIAGILLLVPPIRRAVRGYVTARLKAKVMVSSRASGPRTEDEQIIDVEHYPTNDSRR